MRTRDRGDYSPGIYKLWIAVLSVVFLWGLYAASEVVTKGLVVTGLNDIVSWGLWIAADTSFISFSAGAFMVATAVYVLKIESLKPLGRISIFTGMIGYSMALMVLALDLGRPDRFWHPMVYWNKSSFIWEVVLSINFYFAILVIEFLPVLAELAPVKRRLPFLGPLAKKLHCLMPFLALAGLLFSLMHQASLGAIFSAVRARPYWYRPNVPIMFVASCMVAGPALLLLGNLVLEKVVGKVILAEKLVTQLVQLIAITFAAFTFMRLWDLIHLFYHDIPLRGEAAAILSQSRSFWIGELFIGVVVPAAILLAPTLRRSRSWLSIAMLALLVGAFAYRWNIIVPGLTIPPISPDITLLTGTYRPSWVEWATTAGTVAFGMLAYTIGSRYLSLFPQENAGHLEFVTLTEVLTEPS